MTINRSVVIVTEDAVAAAMLSSYFYLAGKYVAVIEPPRMQRPDVSSEVARVINIVRRINPELTIFVGIEKEGAESIQQGINSPIMNAANMSDLAQLRINTEKWKNKSVEEAVNMLIAEGGQLEIPIKAVVYNGPADIGYVISANYAIYHKSQLIRFETPESAEGEVVEKLNKIDAVKDEAVRRIDIDALSEYLSSLLPVNLKNINYERTLMITEGIPYSMVWPAKKVIYSNRLMIGSFLAHNIYEKEWGEHERIGSIGLYVADRNVEVKGEYECFENAISSTRGLTKRLITNHPKLTEMEILTTPYDVMYIATHGRQLEGYLEKYLFKSSDGEIHEVLIKRAAGLISMVVFIQEIDGINKSSSEWLPEHGNIWVEFQETYINPEAPKEFPEPESREATKLDMRALVLGREPGQQSPFAIPRLASQQRPIVIANACGSWTDMCSLFMFAGASSYIGTLWQTVSSTAYAFAQKFNSELFNEPLATVFFDSRDSLASEIDRMNYVFTGSFENKYDSSVPFSSDGLTEIKKRLIYLLVSTKRNIRELPSNAPNDVRNNAELDEYWYKKTLKDLKDSE